MTNEHESDEVRRARLNIRPELNGCIKTISGVYINPTIATIEQIKIYDIAHALSLMNRYAGHSLWPYSVAQHSVLLFDYLDDHGVPGLMRLYPEHKAEINNRPKLNTLLRKTLLHDASEAYMPDIPGPFKGAFPDYLGHEKRLQATIFDRFGLTHEFPKLLKFVDGAIINNEMDVLSPGGAWGYITELGPLANVKIEQWSPERSRAEFLSRFRKMWPHETVSL